MMYIYPVIYHIIPKWVCLNSLLKSSPKLKILSGFPYDFLKSLYHCESELDRNFLTQLTFKACSNFFIFIILDRLPNSHGIKFFFLFYYFLWPSVMMGAVTCYKCTKMNSWTQVHAAGMLLPKTHQDMSINNNIYGATENTQISPYVPKLTYQFVTNKQSCQ